MGELHLVRTCELPLLPREIGDSAANNQSKKREKHDKRERLTRTRLATVPGSELNVQWEWEASEPF